MFMMPVCWFLLTEPVYCSDFLLGNISRPPYGNTSDVRRTPISVKEIFLATGSADDPTARPSLSDLCRMSLDRAVMWKREGVGLSQSFLFWALVLEWCVLQRERRGRRTERLRDCIRCEREKRVESCREKYEWNSFPLDHSERLSEWRTALMFLSFPPHYQLHHSRGRERVHSKS